MGILKTLNHRRKTVSELERESGISKSTLHENLAKLVEAGLVSRKGSENEFVYYELTNKGMSILNPNGAKFAISLVLTVVSSMGAALYIYRLLRPLLPSPVEPYVPYGRVMLITFILILSSITLGYYTLKAWKEYAALKKLNKKLGSEHV